jgi:predicted DNA-binding transcriptional regulator AlpA
VSEQGIDERYIGTTQFAEMVGASPRTVMLWRERNYGPPYYKIGHRIRYWLPDVQEWIEGCREDPEKPEEDEPDEPD